MSFFTRFFIRFGLFIFFADSIHCYASFTLVSTPFFTVFPRSFSDFAGAKVFRVVLKQNSFNFEFNSRSADVAVCALNTFSDDTNFLDLNYCFSKQTENYQQQNKKFFLLEISHSTIDI